MDGVFHSSLLNTAYLRQLLAEYHILEKAQLYSLLKNTGGYKRRERHRLIRRLEQQIGVMTLEKEGRSYLSCSPKALPTGKYQRQIVCFWILLDYIEQVDRHFATGSYTRIAMTIGGQDYDIVYVVPGEERLCIRNIDQSGPTRYIVVVDTAKQIPLIHHEKIKTFATVTKTGTVRYYTQNRGDTK